MNEEYFKGLILAIADIWELNDKQLIPVERIQLGGDYYLTFENEVNDEGIEYLCYSIKCIKGGEERLMEFGEYYKDGDLDFYQEEDGNLFTAGEMVHNICALIEKVHG